MSFFVLGRSGDQAADVSVPALSHLYRICPKASNPRVQGRAILACVGLA